jgi:hypothetical protein
MNKGRKVAIVATALALALAGAAGAAHTGMLSVRVGGGSPEAGGIKVHGKWSLVVRNKQGKVVARRHFENALTASGAYALVEALTGGTASEGLGARPPSSTNQLLGGVGGQGVLLEDGSTAGHGCRTVLLTNACFVSHLDGSPTEDDKVGTGPLHVSATASSLTLSASITPPVTTTFTRVETELKICGIHASGFSVVQYSGEDCSNEDETDGYDWVPFTSKTITPLTVQGSQSVAVSVKISFS